MASKLNGLGKGLEALFQSISDETIAEKDLITDFEDTIEKNIDKKEVKDRIVYLKLIDIEPDKDQARKLFDEKKLEELSNSIKKFGVIQPILVVKNNNYYKIIAGERRWRASKLAGMKTIPAIILENEKEKNTKISLIENVHRSNLNPIERAKAYKNIMETYNMGIDEFAESISKSPFSIKETLKYLELDSRVQELALKNNVSESLCKVLIKTEDKDLQYEIALYVLEDGLDVDEALKRLKIRTKSSTQKNKDIGNIFSQLRDIENRLTTFFGSKTKVVINKKFPDKGKIILSYSSNEDLERLLNLLEKK